MTPSLAGDGSGSGSVLRLFSASVVAAAALWTAFCAPAAVLATVFTPLERSAAHANKHVCGGTFTEKHGVVSTPNFPGEFPVPIECKWIFRGSPGDHISLYLTQFYLKEGVHAAAYGFYSDDNIFMAKDDLGAIQADASVSYVTTRKPVLVLTMNLITTENVNIRVKDRFLDVYGFNITYEMRRPRSSNSGYACTVFGCAFNGHCLASPSFRHYKCQCFPGFFGADCQYGPGCDPERNVEVCQNGGKCSYVTGSTGIQCSCPPGFTGARCETMYLDGMRKQCEATGANCSQICTLDVGNTPKCSCYQGFELGSDNKTCQETGVTRYVASLKLKNLHIDPMRVNVSSEDYVELKRKVEVPLAEFLQEQLTKRVELSISSFFPGAIIEFQFLALNGESGIARDALAEIVNNGSLGSDLMFDSHFFKFEREPSLNLQKVDMDVPSPAETGWNMTLTCIATGSRDLRFQWLKDGSKVVVAKAMRPCKEVVWPRNSRNQYTTQLVIGNVQRVDGGVFTCKVSDWNGYQERSILVKVQTPPTVILEPAGEITVPKGSNFSVACSSADDSTGQNGYTWMKNGQLVSDESEIVTEDLYPDGSRIYVRDLQSKVRFSCVVTNAAGNSVASVSVTPMNPEDDDDDVCTAQEAFGITWPLTMRGQTSLQPCPAHYSGHSRRLCDFQSPDDVPQWDPPNFDDCHSSTITLLKEKLDALRYGYEVIQPEHVPDELLADLAIRAPVLPQSGVEVLNVVGDASDYMISLGMKTEMRDSIDDFCNVFNFILSNTTVLPTSWISTAISLMQRHFATNRFGEEHDKYSIVRLNFAYYSANFHGNEREEAFPFESRGLLEWTPRERVRVAMEKYAFPVVGADENLEVSVIFFRNLSQFLPHAYSEHLNTTRPEKDLELISQAVSVSLQKGNNNDVSHVNGLVIEVEFPLADERLNSTAWIPVCGRGRNMGPMQTVSVRWEPFACQAHVRNQSSVICSCKQFGIFALLITPSDIEPESDPWGFYTEIIVASALALVLLMLAFAMVILQWTRLSDTMGLSKAQEIFASAAATALILTSSRSSLPEDMFPYVITSLTFAFNLIISTQFCRPVFVYVEHNMISTLHGHKLKIGILSWGLPSVTTAAAMAAQEMQGWDLDSWWLVPGSMFFYGAAIPFFILLVLFFWVYFLAMSSIRRRLLQAEREAAADAGKNFSGLYHRAHREHSLLQRSSLVVWSSMVFFIASVYFVNDQESTPKTYFLSFSMLLHAMTNWFFYVAKNEYRIPLWKTVFHVDEFFANPPPVGINFVDEGLPEKTEEEARSDHENQPIRARTLSKSKTSSSSSRTQGGSVETLPMENLHSNHHGEHLPVRLERKSLNNGRPRLNGAVSVVGAVDIHC